MSGDSIEQVVDSYAEYLYVYAGDGHLKRFVERLRANEEAAQAEAVLFSWAHASDLRPEILETLSHGGMDFVCRPSTGGAFELEVTALGAEAASAKSGLPTDPFEEGGGAFSLLTRTLRGRIKNKIKQLAASPSGLPRVIALVSLHRWLTCYSIELPQFQF